MNNWRTVPLGEVCFVSAGNSAPQDKKLFEGGTYPFIRTADVGRVRFGEISSAKDLLNKAGIRGLRLVPKDTVLMPKSGASTYLNYRVLMTTEAYVASHLATLTPRSEYLVPRYLLYTMRQMRAQDILQDQGYPSLSLSLIKKIPITLPPLAEQRAIVARLDAAFVQVTVARKNIEANLADADALFQSVLAQSFTPQDYWDTKTMGEITTFRPNKKQAKETLKDSDKVSFVPMEYLNIGNRNLSLEMNRELSEVYRAYTYFADGDVLLPKITPCFENGKLGIAKNLTNGVGFGSSEFFVFRPSQKIHASYIYHFLSRTSFREQLASKMTGAVGHKRIPRELVENLPISFPPPAEQKRIVHKLDALRADIDRVQTAYRAQQADLDALHQALLHSAFTGQLTNTAA